MLSPVSKIDITPLVGVALILVIVFMVTSPLMMVPVDLEIDLPKAKTVEAKSETNITISISRDNILALDDREIPFERLESELRRLLEKRPDRLVVVRADKNLRHRLVIEILTVAKRSGGKRLAIATLQRNRSKI